MTYSAGGSDTTTGGSTAVVVNTAPCPGNVDLVEALGRPRMPAPPVSRAEPATKGAARAVSTAVRAVDTTAVCCEVPRRAEETFGGTLGARRETAEREAVLLGMFLAGGGAAGVGGGGVFFEVAVEEERMRSSKASLLFLSLGCWGAGDGRFSEGLAFSSSLLLVAGKSAASFNSASVTVKHHSDVTYHIHQKKNKDT